MARAAIFDLDGTLIDSMTDIGIACNAALRVHGKPDHPIEAYRAFVGEGVVHLLTRALHPQPFDEAVLATYKLLYPKQMFAHTAPYPGIAEALRELVASGMPLGVLSNKPHPPTAELVAHFFGDVPWRGAYGHRPEWPRKPDPTAALALCAELGVPPDACAFVGDSAVDVATGRNAGMAVVGVLWGFRPHEARTADAVAHDAAQLPRLIRTASAAGVQTTANM
ncbi:MAG: HAD family hydrolase [Deltaproteobacteria bacterium]|nr:HAD family hydrolase [Deltaproteobacteria bacterium]